MSAEREKMDAAGYAAQLSTIERRLQERGDDETMLADVGAAMRVLLSDDESSEAQIRATLQKQFDAGNLGPETYESLQDLLGQVATEELVRSSVVDPTSETDDIFATTTVIEDPPGVKSAAATGVDSDTPIQLQIGSVLRDRFLLTEKVAEGSMGVVYKALDRRLAEAGDEECSVAIKVLSAELSRNGAALRALQQEANKGRCLSHPNIVRFNDLDREGELYFIVMEWLEGRSLSRILDESGGNGVDVETALGILQQAAQALDYAHQRGVIHADVKPGNIVVSSTGNAKLIDFGVARVRQKEQEGRSRSDLELLRGGTAAYSSMQVLTGEVPVPTDDVFSLACLFYRMVAGFRVFGPRNAAQAAEEGMEPQRPQTLSKAMWQPLKKALSYSRVTRYASPGEFVSALSSKAADSSAQLTKEPQPAEGAERVPDIRQAQPKPKPVALPPVKVDATDTPASFDNAALIGKVAASRTLPDNNELPQPGRNLAAPMRAETASIMYESEDDEPRRSILGLVLLLILAVAVAVLVTRTDIVDRIGLAIATQDFTPIAEVFTPITEILEGDAEFVDIPAVDESLQSITEYVAGDDVEAGSDTSSSVADAAGGTPTDDALFAPPPLEESLVETPPADAVIAPVVEEIPAPAENLIDWSLLPEPLVSVELSEDAGTTPTIELAIREGSSDAILDFVRTETTSEFTLDVREADFSGNQSPRESGQYTLQNDGRLVFAPGEDRARLTIAVRSNPVREADRQVTLLVGESGIADSVHATIQLTLEDDDQRAFEEGLPPNTVAFAVNQISVREYDPAAQIDVIRYQPDDSSLEVSYELTDVTASEGQDYFAPDISVVYFAPGQRLARILIPLGQDSRPEADEAFMLQLDTAAVPAEAKLFSQIAVMIRDDDT